MNFIFKGKYTMPQKPYLFLCFTLYLITFPLFVFSLVIFLSLILVLYRFKSLYYSLTFQNCMIIN